MKLLFSQFTPYLVDGEYTFGTQGQQIAATFEQFYETHIAGAPVYTIKGAQPLGKMATYTGNSRASGATLEQIYGYELDYDNETFSIEAAAQVLHDAQVNAILYTSFSHTPDTPRWRVMLPLSQPYAADYGEEGRQADPRRNAVLDAIEQLMLDAGGQVGKGGMFFGAEQYDTTRGYYIGRPGGEFKHVYIEGHPIDAHPNLEALAERGAAHRVAGQGVRKTYTQPEGLEGAVPVSATATLPLNERGQIDRVMAFNKTMDIGELLLAHGYTRHSAGDITKVGDKFQKPNSSHEAGVVVLLAKDGSGDLAIISHHENDPLHVMRMKDERLTLCAQKAFDIFKILVCGGDFKAAKFGAGEILQVGGETVNQFNRLVYEAAA